jgi:hypothetical protein
MKCLRYAAPNKEQADVVCHVFMHRPAVNHWQMIAIVTIVLIFSAPSFGQSTRGATEPILSYPPIPEAQRVELIRIARDTWRFYAADIDPNTHLPMDNFGANSKREVYVSR